MKPSLVGMQIISPKAEAREKAAGMDQGMETGLTANRRSVAFRKPVSPAVDTA
jgi:hypothetical protein